jgi:hypothetical protein
MSTGVVVGEARQVGGTLLSVGGGSANDIAASSDGATVLTVTKESSVEMIELVANPMAPQQARDAAVPAPAHSAGSTSKTAVTTKKSRKQLLQQLGKNLRRANPKTATRRLSAATSRTRDALRELECVQAAQVARIEAQMGPTSKRAFERSMRIGVKCRHSIAHYTGWPQIKRTHWSVRVLLFLRLVAFYVAFVLVNTLALRSIVSDEALQLQTYMKNIMIGTEFNEGGYGGEGTVRPLYASCDFLPRFQKALTRRCTHPRIPPFTPPVPAPPPIRITCTVPSTSDVSRHRLPRLDV